MTPEAAIFSLLGELGIPTYAATSVPDDATYPYATVEMAVGAFWDGEVPLPVSLWYYGDSESGPNAGARALAQVVGPGGRVVACDGGAVWVKRGSPFSQSMGDPTDDKIKRRYVNLTAEFITSL